MVEHYVCPMDGCDYTDPDPSYIGRHIVAEHKTELVTRDEEIRSTEGYYNG